MLYFSRWKTAAILGTTLIVCLAALTNVLPAATFDSLPSWAQHKIELGMELRGGTRVQLQVDTNDIQRYLVEKLRDDVRSTMRQGRLGYTHLVLHDDRVELRVRDEADLSQALTRLRDIISLPVAAASVNTSPVTVRAGETNLTADRDASPPARVADMVVDDRLVRLTLTHGAVSERTLQARNQAIDMIDWRLRSIGAEARIRPVGGDRVVVESVDSLVFERWFHLVE
jgi:preprotein translocase subunit SecD